MTTAKGLFELQQVDLDIDRLSRLLAQVESQLGDREALDNARAELDAARESLSSLGKEQKQHEYEVEDLRNKVKEIELKLYGGTVKVHKELQAMQEDAKQIKARQKGEEDAILELMTKIEEANGKVGALTSKWETMDREWTSAQAQLTTQRDSLKAELATLGEKRQQMASTVLGPFLAMYELLRTAKQGRAVAKVERGMCTGCRLTLPMNQIQRARAGHQLVQCTSCNRILYVS